MTSKYVVVARIFDIIDGEPKVLMVRNLEEERTFLERNEKNELVEVDGIKPEGWGLPGGRVRENDLAPWLDEKIDSDVLSEKTLEHILRREVREEAGMELGGLAHARTDRGDRIRVLYNGWDAKGDMVPKANDIIEARWLTYEDVLRGEVDGVPIYWSTHRPDALEVFENPQILLEALG